MKKIISYAILPTIILFFSLGVVFAQSPTAIPNEYATAYQDYLNKGGEYQASHNDYQIARSTYLASQSLDSKEKAQQATLKMLQARDTLVSAYLNAIKVKIKITSGITDADRSSYSGQLDSEISWYNSHNNRLASAGSLEDLVADSTEAQNQFGSSTLLLVYSSLTTLGIGNNSFIRGELKDQIAILQAKITEIKANQDKDVSGIERSIVDIQNKLDRSQTKDSDAKNLILNIKATDQNKNNDFQDAQSDIVNSNLYLQEATQGLLQIITQIKTAS